jgi:hypothetical protein
MSMIEQGWSAMDRSLRATRREVNNSLLNSDPVGGVPQKLINSMFFAVDGFTLSPVP